MRLIGRGQVGAGRVYQVVSGHAACATVPRPHVRWLGEPPPRRSDRVSPGGESGPPGIPGPSAASPDRRPGAPRHLSTDHDPLFEAHRWTANLRLLEIDAIKTVPHVPLSHPFVERLIGTMRRECLDHVLCWNAGDLERKLADFQASYNAARSHASWEGYTPLGFAGERTAARAEFNHVRWISHCRGMVQLPAAA